MLFLTYIDYFLSPLFVTRQIIVPTYCSFTAK